jgi:hypothetical protein
MKSRGKKVSGSITLLGEASHDATAFVGHGFKDRRHVDAIKSSIRNTYAEK